MEVKKIVEGMTASQVAQVIDDNFKAQNAILEEDIAKQNSVIGVSEYKDFSEAEAVNVGDVRKYNGFLYECVEATTGAFDASKWKKSSFKAEMEKKLSELGQEYTYSGIANGSFGWISSVDFKKGYTVKNTGNVRLNLYKEKDNSSEYTTIENGDTIILPFDVRAIRDAGFAGNYELRVSEGARNEIESEILLLQQNLYRKTISGDTTSGYAWVGYNYIKEGSIVTNLGDVKVNLYKEKIESSSNYVTANVGDSIVLPFDVRAIRSAGKEGHFELHSTWGARSEIDGEIKDLQDDVLVLKSSVSELQVEVNSRLTHISKSVVMLSETETLSIDESPRFIKIGDEITLSATIESFGNGFTIGKGETTYTSGYLDITPTECVMKSYKGSEQIESRIEHGLTFEDFIKVVIKIDDKINWSVIVQTLQGTFVHSFHVEANAGSPRITSNGAVLRSVSLTYFNPLLWNKIWAFGDSYFGVTSQNREMYWLKEWGYLNFMLSGYPGAASSAMYAELERCIRIAKPEYVIWCLGMNDNGSLSSWENNINKVLYICKANGTEVVLCTIPEVRNNTSYLNKDEMSSWVKNSGQRYIDVQKAVGANSEGEWYGNGTEYDYQSSDNVHPSEYGAKAIATQFIVDVPEIAKQ